MHLIVVELILLVMEGIIDERSVLRDLSKVSIQFQVMLTFVG